MSSHDSRRELRRQSDVASVRALAELLRCIAKKPGQYLESKTLLNALRSQGALAKFDGGESSIIGMSLNHQRRVADSALGGYGVLDELRRAAREAVLLEESREKRGNARSKSGLAARVRELESDNLLLKQDLALLQRAYDMRCMHARNYAAAGGPEIRALCAKEQKELDRTFSLRRTPVERSNVVDITEARDRAQPRTP